MIGGALLPKSTRIDDAINVRPVLNVAGMAGTRHCHHVVRSEGGAILRSKPRSTPRGAGLGLHPLWINQTVLVRICI